MFIGVGFLFTFLVGWILLGSQGLEKRFRHAKNDPDEIQHRTVETSATTNDRLTTIHKQLQQLDSDARMYFGELHFWHNPDEEPAPKQINIFNHSLNDPENRFLQMYNNIAESRLRNQKMLDKLSNEVDGTVNAMGGQTTADFEFRSRRLLTIDMDACLTDLERQIKNLNDLGKKFQEGNGQSW